jgi:membrane protein DedA with SNARE-associated domain
VLKDFVQSLYDHLGYSGVVIAMAIESCCIPLPSEIIMPFAGALTVSSVATSLNIHHTFGLLGVTFAGALGCLIGSIIAYAIGATGGRDLLLKYGRYVLISRHDAELADVFFAKHGDVTIFVSRILPIVRTFISLPAGMTRMNFPRFLLFTFLGSLPWCFVLALIGQKLGQNWDNVGNWIHRFDILIAVAIVALAVLYVRRHLRLSKETPTAA